MKSEVCYNAAGDAVSFSGPDAVELFRAATLASAMTLYAAGIRPSRNAMSATQALKAATAYTGIKYARGEFAKAKSDLGVWISEMKAALPSRTV